MRKGSNNCCIHYLTASLSIHFLKYLTIYKEHHENIKQLGLLLQTFNIENLFKLRISNLNQF